MEQNPVQIIGIIVHEVGHAFNIAAQIANTETNAYIFEIEVLSHWYNSQNQVLAKCSREEILLFFNNRLEHYLQQKGESEHLDRLIENIYSGEILIVSTPHQQKTPR